MDTSSESDLYEGTLENRCRGREAHRRAGRDRTRGGGGGGDGRTAEISQKISTLANTLQDTSKNLTKVDRMLGQYREHTDDQAEAMVLLRENLEESISQLQKQRLGRTNGALSGAASASASTLHTSDLDACSGSEERRFVPTSPLKDYTSPPGRRRRSRSASVRFKDSGLSVDDVHTLHQSLRDLRSDQLRLSDDLDREILRRNRSDVDTRRAMESLTEHMAASHRQDSVSSRVERRLRELERERRSPEDERRAQEPWEGFGRSQIQEREEAAAARLLKADRERAKTEQELERARRLLEQAEESRDSLSQQVEDMRGELQRTRKEKTGLQRALLETPPPSAPPHGSHSEREGGGGARQGPDRSDLEREVAELRVQLCKASVLGEVEELKRALDLKEKERVQLGLQLKELSSDLAAREQQQLRMLEQLRDLQSRGQAERRETEALLQESARSREELKTRAQEAVRQWRAKCRRLQKALEEETAQARLHSDKASQAVREKESCQAQLKALSQQAEAARRELAVVLGRLAQREEELHRKEVELSESLQRCLALQQESREVKESKGVLEEELQRQSAIQSRLRDENHRLEEEAEAQTRRCQRDRDAQAELQASLKQLKASHTQLAQRLAEEERSRKELLRDAGELKARLRELQEERDGLSKQLQLQRDGHRRELDNLRASAEEARARREREAQEALRLCRQEREEMETQLKEAKADAAADQELCAALRVKLDRMKDECDKLAAQLSTKEDVHTLLQRKYQLLKQELEDNVRSGERRRASESEAARLEQKLLEAEAEQEAVLTSLGEELDAACRGLAHDGDDKLQAISQRPGLVKDPHRWLAETKTKLRWLCEEVRERDAREQRLKKQHHQTRDQLKALRQSRDSEQAALLRRLDQQERLLHALSAEKKELLERSQRKEEEMRSLQNTKAALDHLESIPEKQCLMENFRDLEESQQQRDMVEQRYSKYKEMVWDLQHQLDESKRRIQEHKDEKLDAASRSLRLAALSSSIRGSGALLDAPSPNKRLTSSDLEESAAARTLAD
ncbi:centrosomal protein of 128 kDa isoform X2 [Salarias fasciatus]|uniref:centrosomal protein of 128 kDa isoform X2 n=1 Tax=Salarias fasciatus TaxID=181472 RepID=UPI001176F028|nr:centrosomal protein of 128 kDa isoform X2 [Salarias fasciatus]